MRLFLVGLLFLLAGCAAGPDGSRAVKVQKVVDALNGVADAVEAWDLDRDGLIGDGWTGYPVEDVAGVLRAEALAVGAADADGDGLLTGSEWVAVDASGLHLLLSVRRITPVDDDDDDSGELVGLALALASRIAATAAS